MSTVEDSIGKLFGGGGGVVQYLRDIMIAYEGYHQYSGECAIQ